MGAGDVTNMYKINERGYGVGYTEDGDDIYIYYITRSR